MTKQPKILAGLTIAFWLACPLTAVAVTVASAPTTILALEDLTASSDPGFLVKVSLDSPLNASCANSTTGWLRVAASEKADIDRLFTLALYAFTNAKQISVVVDGSACSNNYQRVLSIRLL